MNASSNSRGFSGRPWLTALAGGVLVVAAVAVYWQSVGVPFLFDDAPAIERNGSIRQLWPLRDVLVPPQTAAGATGRPMVNLTLALNYAMGGLDPRGYHVVNVLLHVLAGLALFGLIRRTLTLPAMGGRYRDRELVLALGTSAWWMVHPLLTESVVCVVQRNEILVSLFYLLMLYCFARSTTAPRSGWWQTLAVVSCLLGMASKEVMATAPLMVWLYDRTFVAGSFREAWRARRRLYFALAGTWVLLAVLVWGQQQRAGTVGFGLGVSPWNYLLTECRALTTYLGLSAWPHPLILDYGVDVAKGASDVWLQGLVVIALLAATVVALWRRPILGFVAAWFFLLLAPSSSFLPLTTQPIAEHRMYLSLSAVLMLVVAGIWAVLGRKTWWIVGASAAVMACLTIQRVGDYRSEEGIWRDTIAKIPSNARAYASLGNVFARQERWAEAKTAYEKAIELRPDYADAQSDYGSVLLKLGEAEAALPHLKAAVRLKPGDNQIQSNLAAAQAQARHFSEAVETLGQILRRDPSDATAWSNLGDALLKASRKEEAIAAFEHALAIEPGFAAAHNNAGLVLVASGRVGEAVKHYAKAAEVDPENWRIRSNYGDALLQSGHPSEAAVEYQAAARLNPRLAGLHYNLGNVWLRLNRLADAVREYEAELAIQPGFAAAHNNLGLALSRLGSAQEAIPHFEETLRQLPGSAETHYNLAVALGLVGKIDEAVAHDEEALKFQPDFPEVRRHLAEMRRRK